MKVTMLTTLCSPEGNAFPGTVLDVEKEVADVWIRDRFARPFDREKDAKPKQVGLQKATPSQ